MSCNQKNSSATTHKISNFALAISVTCTFSPSISVAEAGLRLVSPASIGSIVSENFDVTSTIHKVYILPQAGAPFEIETATLAIVADVSTKPWGKDISSECDQAMAYADGALQVTLSNTDFAVAKLKVHYFDSFGEFKGISEEFIINEGSPETLTFPSTFISVIEKSIMSHGFATIFVDSVLSKDTGVWAGSLKGSYTENNLVDLYAEMAGKGDSSMANPTFSCDVRIEK